MASFIARLRQMLFLLSLIISLASAKKHGKTRGVGLQTEAPTESPIQSAIESDITIAPISMTDETTDLGTITDVAAGDMDLFTLVYLLNLAGIADALAVDGPLTVFAPTNAAFDTFLSGGLPSLGIDDIAGVLSYHVVLGSYMASDITDGLILETLLGETIEFGIDGGVVTVNGQVISTTDIPASNGLIHKIDGVLIPNSIFDADDNSDVATITGVVEGDDDLSTLAELLTLTGLSVPLSGGPGGPLKMTLFAPTDVAFSGVDLSALGIDEVAGVLRYHVVIGVYTASDITDGLILETLLGETIEFGIDDGIVTVNGQVISTTDISASNGMVHKIDGVMLPKAIIGEPEDTAPADTTPDDASDVGTITDIAAGNDDFSILVELLTLTGLADALAGDGPLTVFAPTNSAFAEVLIDTEDFSALDIDQVTQLLTYHVVVGSYMASDITDGLILETLQGETIEFGIEDGVVTVNEEVISTTDISASNGFIHVIDGVMFPKAILGGPEETTPDESSDAPLGTVVDVASADPELAVLVGLVIEADLVDTLSSEGPFTVFAPTDSAFISTLGEEASAGESDPIAIADVLTFFSALDEGVDGSGAGDYDPNVLAQVLKYHVVSGTYLASAIVDGLTLPTVNGETILFGVTGDGVTVNGEAVIVADISASNGVIHKIDGVLVPDQVI